MSTKTLSEAMREWAWERDINYRFDGFQELVARAEKLEANRDEWHERHMQLAADWELAKVSRLEALRECMEIARCHDTAAETRFALQALLDKVPK